MARPATPATGLPYETTYQSLRFPFRVRSNSPEFAELSDGVLAAFRAPEAEPLVTYTLEVDRPDPDRRYALFRDDDCVREGPAPVLGNSLDKILCEATATSIWLSYDYLAVHASAVSWKNRAVIMPAVANSGKTTTAAGLTRAGFEYLTDEAALIDPATGWVHPYPRPLAMSPRSVAAVDGLIRDLPARFLDMETSGFHIPPEYIRPESVGAPCPVAFIVAPKYERGAATTLEPMARAEMLVLLVEQSFNISSHGSAGVRLLGRLVGGARCYRLQIGDLHEAVETIKTLVVP